MLGGIDTVYASTNLRLGNNIENLRFLVAGDIGALGNALDNVFYASAGDNYFDGGAGIDTVVLRSRRDTAMDKTARP